jgi:hypothetical protein
MTYFLLIPGLHEPELTTKFVQSFAPSRQIAIFPHLDRLNRETEIIIIAFSAGVVLAALLAPFWQLQGKQIKALIALDGWGVALGGNFPIHRCSHDYFTHWSSALLGTGYDNFYAEPSVAHLTLFANPAQVTGWRIEKGERYFMTLTNYLEYLLGYYD